MSLLEIGNLEVIARSIFSCLFKPIARPDATDARNNALFVASWSSFAPFDHNNLDLIWPVTKVASEHQSRNWRQNPAATGLTVGNRSLIFVG
jgi:hypothetical protein